MRPLSLLFVLAVNTFAASPVIFGVRGGLPFNTTNTLGSTISGFTGDSSTSQRFEVGPTLGVRLPLGFSVEGDALFRRESYGLGSFGGFNVGTDHMDSWEFPVMLKFTAGHQVIAPVFGAGVTVHHTNNFNSVPSYLFSGTTSANTVGFVAGAGIRFKVGPVNVTPELRYMRWGQDSLSQAVSTFLPLNQNEASFLVGITF